MTADSKKWLKFRLASILAIFLILFIALLSRAFQLQVLSLSLIHISEPTRPY